MNVFGLTGGIASGKSTVAARWRRRGVPVIDADAVAREVVEPGTPGLREIAEAFGQSVLGPTRSLDRAALAHIVFTDDEARKRLNSILHPRIQARVAELAAELERRGEPLACYEAALIVETGAADRYRPLVVVACSEEVQLARVLARGGVSSADALGRIRAQAPLDVKAAVADYLIDTSGSVERSGARSDTVLRAVCDRAHVHPSRYGL